MISLGGVVKRFGISVGWLSVGVTIFLAQAALGGQPVLILIGSMFTYLGIAGLVDAWRRFTHWMNDPAWGQGKAAENPV